MLRKCDVQRRAGDFLFSFAGDFASRAVFALAAPPDAVNDAPALTLARSVTSSFLATSRSAAAKPGLSLPLADVRAGLSTSPLALAANLTPAVIAAAAPAGSTTLAWVGGACDAAAASPVVVGWIGDAPVPGREQRIVAIVPDASGGGVSLRAASIVTGAPSPGLGRVVLSLGAPITAPPAAASSSSAPGAVSPAAGLAPVPSLAGELLRAHVRMEHAAVAAASLQRLCRECVAAGTATKFRDGRMSDAQHFQERVAAIGAAEHVLRAAVHRTAFALGESVASAAAAAAGNEPARQRAARDIAYDSGLLHVLARTLLQSAHAAAERTFLRHGPLPAGAGASFRGVDEWLAAAQGVDVPALVLHQALFRSATAAASATGAADAAPLAAAAASSAGQQSLRDRFSGLFRARSNPALVDVHMNLLTGAAGITRDFEALRGALAAAPRPAAAGDATSGAAADLELLLAAHAVPIAAELMGATSVAYYATNVLELGEAAAALEQPQASAAATATATAAGARGAVFPGSDGLATPFASASEASAVAWLAVEVAFEQSAARRAKSLRDLAAARVAAAVAAGGATSHPAFLPRAAERKQNAAEEDA
jgi:hypothetical protein